MTRRARVTLFGALLIANVATIGRMAVHGSRDVAGYLMCLGAAVVCVRSIRP